MHDKTGGRTEIGQVMAMRKYDKRMSSVLAILLVGAVLLNNNGVYSVFAAEGNRGENISDSAYEGGAEQGEGSSNGSAENEPGGAGDNNVPGENQPGGNQPGDNNTPEGSQPGENQPGGDNNTPGESQPGDNNTPEGNQPGENQPGEDNNTPGESQPGGDNNTPGESQPGDNNTPEGNQPGENQPGEDNNTPGESQPGDNNTPEGTQPGDSNAPGEGLPGEDNVSGEGEPEEGILPGEQEPGSEEENGGGEEGIPSCVEDREHEYEEILGEDGAVEGYRCVFCQREIDEETLESEGASLHAHIWNRAEGEIVPVCEACAAQRLDCDGEDGYGIHIFVLRQEEGQPDLYYCVVCGLEKEWLDEWDMTAELFQEIMGVSMFARTFDYGTEQSTIPITVDELRAAETSGYYTGGILPVNNLADLMALCELNKDGFDFEGYTVQFGVRTNVGAQWDLTPLKNDFEGLGTEQFPFRGTLTTYYTGGSLTFQTATPFLNYVATGAKVSELQVNAVIDHTDSGPVGAIAAHVVSDGTSDTVTVENVSVSGSIKNSGGAAGILFGEVGNNGTTPIQIQYRNSGDPQKDIELTASVEAQYAGGLAGKTSGPVEVHQTNVFPSGTVTGSVYGGMLAGYLGPDAVLVLEGAENGLEAKVYGSGANGGLVGGIENGTVRQTDGKPIKITGTVEGSTAGGFLGRCADTGISLENLTMEATVAGSQDAGGVIGVYTGNGTGTPGASDWWQLHHIKMSGRVAGGSHAGGVAGYVEGSRFRIGKAEETAPFDCIQISGTVSATGAAGGVIGTANGEYIEVCHAAVSGSIADAAVIGGIIGRVSDYAVVKAANAMVSAGFNPGGDSKIQGGIFGEVAIGGMAAMDGEIQADGLSIDNSTAMKGFIAGKQEEALVYFEEGCHYTRPNTAGKNWVDDIGSYGGVYRNGSWGEGNALISYVDKKVSGSVQGGGNSWVLDTEADVMRLAIALNTEGKFAGDCFGNAGKTALLSARYDLSPSDGSFDLEESGIYCLNRNDRGKSDAECFKGQMVGQGKTELRLGNCTTYQSWLSLFPYAGSGAVFENLTVDRGISYVKNGAAGLAVYGSDNIAVRNVNIDLDLTSSADPSRYYYGGMFADYSAAKGTTLEVSGSRIGGNFRIEQNGAGEGQKHYAGGLIAIYKTTGGTGDLPVIKIDGLGLAEKITTGSRFVSSMITYINENNTNQARVTLAMRDIHVEDGARLEINSQWGTAGFLGWGWYDIAPYKDPITQESYSIKNLTIGNGTTAAEGPYFSTRGGFGGIVYTVCGRIQLKNTRIENATFTAAGGGPNGLLFNDGRKALIELDGYWIAGEEVGQRKQSYPATAGKVAITGAGANFSDIVGINSDAANRNKFGGIVNIISKGFADDMITYGNHPWEIGSNVTRYYYNLFGNTLDAEDSYLAGRELDKDHLVVADGDQMMIWHLSQYMDDGLRQYLKPYFKNGNLPNKNSSVEIKGTIDLKGKSYYPTPIESGTVNGGEKARVIFYGRELAEGSNKRAGDAREHYLMHGGLLLSEGGTVTVQGAADDYLTLSGTVSHMSTNSGALFPGAIGGIKNIYRIRLDNLFVYDYKGAVHGVGLLVGNVMDNTTVDISWIETKNYQKIADKYAASALIGQVGTMQNGVMTTENLKLDFTNIDVDDSRHAGVFSAATLIDKHYYTDKTEINKGRVRYLFTEEAYKGGDGTGNTREPFTDAIHGENNYAAPYVTVGKELKEGIEYWNVDGDADLGIADADWDSYLPYVCEGKGIRVNPKNASITKGCGTYEDPYQITSAKQLLALSRYLINGEWERDLEGWQIRAVGDRNDTNGNGICEQNHEDGSLKTYTYGELKDGFPTRDDLRQAYYVIQEDIDFTGLSGATDKNAAMEYVGLGTENYPFAGVIIGKKMDGSRPIVTLPYKRKNNSCANFGLVQYAKGAVVKNLEIISLDKVSDSALLATTTTITHVTNMGGTAIACILGGDNIIDQVKVGSRIAADSGDTAAGGYVGIVQQGSLILRGLEEANLEGFHCGLWNRANDGTMAEFVSGFSSSAYPYVSGAVGKVENGFVIYEGGSAGGKILPHESKTIAGIYRHAALPFSNTYDIITAEEMEKEAKIPITWPSADSFECQVGTAAQLQIVSMAINSDSFSVCYNAGGYDEKAVCRKAEYSQTGLGEGSAGDDYTKATKKDDKVFWYPYIYQYFTFGGKESEDSVEADGSGFYRTLSNTSGKQYKSRLNAVTPDIRDTMTYRLVDAPGKGMEEADYDLSVYRRGFRGLGATYRIFSVDGGDRDNGALKVRDTGIYSDFRANFDGAGATVKAEMVNDYAKELHTIALFNDLVCAQERAVDYYIKNLIVTGTFHSSDYADNDNINYGVDRAAAVVGMMRCPWKMEKITVFDADISSKGHAAGIVAWIAPGLREKPDYHFSECQVLALSKDTLIHTKGGSCGGIVGIMGLLKDETSAFQLKMDKCKITGNASGKQVKLKNEGETKDIADSTDPKNENQERAGRGRSGAMVGHVGKRRDGSNSIRIEMNVIINGSGTSPDIQYVTIDGAESTGGVLGEYYGCRRNGSSQNVVINNITVSDSVLESKNMNSTSYGGFGVGGIIGKLQREAKCDMTAVKVENTNIRSSYGTETVDAATTAGQNRIPDGDVNAGGMIGYCYRNSQIVIKDAQVMGSLVDGKPQYGISSRLSYAGGIIGAALENVPNGGYIEAQRSNIVIENTVISGMDIVSDSRRAQDKQNDTASGQSVKAAGGIIGQATMMDLSCKDTKVEDCVIRSGKGSAGGVAGEIFHQDVSRTDTTLEGVQISRCTIGSNGSIAQINDSAGSGGIFGRVNASENMGSQKLKTVNVTESTIYGKNTGGVAGLVERGQQTGNAWATGGPYVVNIKGNELLGYRTGGVFGLDKGKKMCFDSVNVEDNVILAVRTDMEYSCAGGVCGRKEALTTENNLNHITVKGNRIFSHNGNTAFQSAGGVFGYLAFGENIAEVYSYQASVEDNVVGYYDMAGNIPAAGTLLADASMQGQMEKIKDTLGRAGTGTAKLWNGSRFTDTFGILSEGNIGDYAGYFGNLMGIYEGNGQAYFLMPEVKAPAAGIRPVVDVGTALAGTEGNKLLSYPYAYRKNIHIIYQERDDTPGNTAAEAWRSKKEEEKDRLFSRVNAQKILEAYETAAAGGNADALLDACRLHITDDGGHAAADMWRNVYQKKDNQYVSPLEVAQGAGKMPLPLIVLDTQYGTVDQMMSSVLALLTGAGGVQNSGHRGKDSVYDEGIGRITDMSVTPMKVDNGAITENAGGTESIACDLKEGRWEIFYDEFDTAEADADGNPTGDGTFSLLKITYQQKDYETIDAGTAQGGTVVLQIPVFVVERLTIDTYLKIVEGEVYNADKAKKDGINKEPLLANDSSYTLYTEYIYGDARVRYSSDSKPLTISKTLSMTRKKAGTEEVQSVSFWKGTRLTLIDVCDSDKVYYYTVDGTEDVIKYEFFQDADGNHYQNKAIHDDKGMEVYKDDEWFESDGDEYKKVAVEKFLIVVDTSLVDEETKKEARDISDYHITPVLGSEEIANRTTISEHTELQVTRQPGLVISLDREDYPPLIQGSIQDGTEVEIDGTLLVSGDLAYWTRVLYSPTTTIDSANHYKYLEMGIYLTDTNGNRVKLPDNTNITVNGKQVKPWEEEKKPETNIGSYVNRNEMYFYRDGNMEFPLDFLREIIEEEMRKAGGRTNGKISDKVHIVLNFGNADLADYTEDNYVVHLDLLRIEDAGYPAGGEVIDVHTDVVKARRKTDLACALETKDLMELGINTYHNQTPMPHTVDFDFKLDFNGIISENNTSMNQQIADKYYTVTYHIMEKTNRNGTPVYEPYTGSQLSLALASPPSSDIQQKLEKGASSIGAFANSVYITYKFHWKEIEKGTGSEGHGIITRDLVLTVKDAAKMDLSNYKVVASVLVSDTPPGDIEQEINEALSDFFVFTIAKLKTDLDY